MLTGLSPNLNVHNADGSTGQRNSAGSLATVLSSEQETILSARATEATLSTLNGKVTTTANGVKVDGSAVTQPISATSLPLPTGAATETTLNSVKINTNNLDVALSTRLADATYTTRTGEVQVTPTQYTMLGRLKDIVTQLTTQVRGLFDSAGNAISSTLNFGLRSIPEVSIPFWAKYCDDGVLFSAVAENVTLPTAGTYTPILYITNPGGSGKNLIFKRVVGDSVSGATSIFFEIHYNPTVSVNGTVVTPVNRKAGSATVSVASAYAASTITAQGPLVAEFAVGKDTNSEEYFTNGGMIIPPGNSFIVLGNPGANARLTTLTATWAEI